MKKIFVISVLISLFSCLNAQVAFSKFTFKKTLRSDAAREEK